MKESDITPKVIELAKEIVKYWRMEIYEGCWITRAEASGHETTLITARKLDEIEHYGFGAYINVGFFPVPSISDCLEKLRELQYYVQWNDNLDFYEVFIWKNLDDVPKSIKCKWKLHEALLAALLEVLKEEK